MSPIRLYITYLFILGGICCQGQQLHNDLSHNPFRQEISISDSGLVITNFLRSSCKGYITETIFFPNTPIPTIVVKNDRQINLQPPPKIKLLTIHGRISYDFLFRSKIDTPIYERDFQQHTEQVSLDLLYKEKYPFKVAFTARQSNSPYFRDFIDPNIQFDKFYYNKNLKQDLLNKINQAIPERSDIKIIEVALKEQSLRLNKLKMGMGGPSKRQKAVEEREQKYITQITGKDNGLNNELANRLKDSAILKGQTISYKADSVKEKLYGTYDGEKRKYDSLSENIRHLQKKYDSLKIAAQKDLSSVKQKIYQATNERELRKIARDNGVTLNTARRFDKQLAAIKQFNIGKSLLDYTELTAQNIMVSGVNIEYNPSYYVAFAAGKIDYRFRDFFNKNTKHNKQYLVLGRLGIGNVQKKAVIFTYFQGRKSQSEFAVSDSISNYVNLMGYSVETILKPNSYTSINAEFAKSTKPISGSIQNSKQSGNLFRFSDYSNMGINIKAQTAIPETHTTFSGFYRKTGENFQSFSLFSYNTNQTAWMFRIDQIVMKNKLVVNGMLRQNDFTNPFSEKTFKTTTVFKSISASLKIPKYPSVTIGYYPGTQLYFIDKEKIRENAYYILNGSVIYSYFCKGIFMNSSFVFNRYNNKASDSGFVFYRGVNYIASQTVFLRKWQLQGAYSYNYQPELKYYSLETSFDYSPSQLLKVGAGVKYNKVKEGKSYLGQKGILSVSLKKGGVLQMQYEKSFLPTINQSLYPVEIGRVTWYKIF